MQQIEGVKLEFIELAGDKAFCKPWNEKLPFSSTCTASPSITAFRDLKFGERRTKRLNGPSSHWPRG